MENYKLKHLSKFCCKPADEFEFNLIKEQADKGGVEYHDHSDNKVVYFNTYYNRIQIARDIASIGRIVNPEEISIIDFIKKLVMTEEEAEKLEDDRVELFDGEFRVNHYQSDDGKSYIAKVGHYFKTNADGTEVTLHKRD